MNPEVKAKKKWYLRWWAFLIYGFLILSTIGSLGDAKERAQTAAQNSPAPVAAVEAPAIKVTAIQMSSDYKNNEVAADAKYKGKLVEISGTVNTIGKDILDTPYISLKTEEYAILDQPQCMFARSDEAQLATVNKGQRITLRGTVTGKLGNIIVSDCSIVK